MAANGRTAMATTRRAKKTPIPDWLRETPEEPEPVIEYQLQIADFGQTGCEQLIPLSRHEYLALKAHLAAMRGYSTEQERAA